MHLAPVKIALHSVTACSKERRVRHKRPRTTCTALQIFCADTKHVAIHCEYNACTRQGLSCSFFLRSRCTFCGLRKYRTKVNYVTGMRISCDVPNGRDNDRVRARTARDQIGNRMGRWSQPHINSNFLLDIHLAMSYRTS